MPNFLSLLYEEGYYRILCAQTDKVLEVAGGDVVPGTNIRQWSSVKDKKDQLFSVCVNEDGTYTFKNVASGLTVSLANKDRKFRNQFAGGRKQ